MRLEQRGWWTQFSAVAKTAWELSRIARGAHLTARWSGENLLAMAEPASTQSPTGDSDTCAVFVLEAGGLVVASNTSARMFWSEVARPLVSMPFVTLLAGNEDSSGPETSSSQWLQLRSESLDRWTLRVARRLDGTTCDVRLRLERSSGGAGTYIAAVQPVRR